MTGSAADQSVLVRDSSELETVGQGDILVATATTPDWEPAMKRSAAIITEHGGRTCHAAIVARELGIPVIVGAPNARQLLSDGQEVTVDCSQGMTGRVLEGLVPFSVQTIDIGKLEKPDIDLMVNIANPGAAFRVAALPVAGVGLARTEFIIANEIKAHPMALLAPDPDRQPADSQANRDPDIRLCKRSRLFCHAPCRRGGDHCRCIPSPSGHCPDVRFQVE